MLRRACTATVLEGERRNPHARYFLMTQANGRDLTLAEKVREALDAHDIAAFSGLLHEDVTWGDTNDPRGCRDRSEVLATFSHLLSKGVDGHVTLVETGSAGVLCGLSVQWPEGDPRELDRRMYHVYIVQGGRIVEIQRHDEYAAAARAAGITSA